MLDEIAKKISTRRDIILDSNLLVLLVVGESDRTILRRRLHNRLNDYSESDFDLLKSLVNSRRRCFTTPNVVTEADNLIRSDCKNRRADFASTMAQILNHWSEKFKPSADSYQSDAAARFGLTDAVLTGLGASILVLTADRALAGLIDSHGGHAIHFELLRYWSLS